MVHPSLGHVNILRGRGFKEMWTAANYISVIHILFILYFSDFEKQHNFIHRHLTSTLSALVSALLSVVRISIHALRSYIQIWTLFCSRICYVASSSHTLHPATPRFLCFLFRNSCCLVL